MKTGHFAGTRVRYEPLETIFAQGDRCAAVMYIEKGLVRLTVASPQGRSAVVATLHAGAFFGEGALAGQRLRRSTAESLTRSTIAVVSTREMRRRLHDEVALSDWFRAHMLATNVRIEQDVVGQMFNRSEKRLARVLLTLARFDELQQIRCPLPKISRDLLAEMIGAPRSRVDSLMNKFRKLGFLERHRERDGGIQIHRSMLSVVLQD